MIPLLVAACGLLLAGALLSVVYQFNGSRRDAQNHPPPGRLVDLGTHRLHILECGRGDTTIVMEAGLMSTVLSWTELQCELSQSFRTVSYDRAGLGWSDSGPMPRTADRIAQELHSLLKTAGIAPPYILVGHSFGGLTMPLFASRYPDEVVGMVLVDPVAPEEWNPPTESALKLARIGARVCRRAASLARFGVIRLVASLLAIRTKGVAPHLVRLIARGAPREAGSVSSPWFLALPAQEKTMAGVFWAQSKSTLAIASQLENLPVSARQVAECGSFCDKPVVILSARTAGELRRRGHASMARRLRLGTHVVSEKSNHWIMQGDPATVIRAIESVSTANS